MPTATLPESFPDENPKLTELFKTVLQTMMLEALREGKEYLEISAGELRGRLRGSFGSGNWLPDCCRAMRESFAPDAGDTIVEEPPAHEQARLRIKFMLPRTA